MRWGCVAADVLDAYRRELAAIRFEIWARIARFAADRMAEADWEMRVRGGGR